MVYRPVASHNEESHVNLLRPSPAHSPIETISCFIDFACLLIGIHNNQLAIGDNSSSNMNSIHNINHQINKRMNCVCNHIGNNGGGVHGETNSCYLCTICPSFV